MYVFTDIKRNNAFKSFFFYYQGPVFSRFTLYLQPWPFDLGFDPCVGSVHRIGHMSVLIITLSYGKSMTKPSDVNSSLFETATKMFRAKFVRNNSVWQQIPPNLRCALHVPIFSIIEIMEMSFFKLLCTITNLWDNDNNVCTWYIYETTTLHIMIIRCVCIHICIVLTWHVTVQISTYFPPLNTRKIICRILSKIQFLNATRLSVEF